MSGDPEDNHILVLCAPEAKSGVIVTGDNDLLAIGAFGGSKS